LSPARLLCIEGLNAGARATRIGTIYTLAGAAIAEGAAISARAQSLRNPIQD
jgi:hypothetical protein